MLFRSIAGAILAWIVAYFATSCIGFDRYIGARGRRADRLPHNKNDKSIKGSIASLLFFMMAQGSLELYFEFLSLQNIFI